jgi:hypothetical protein
MQMPPEPTPEIAIRSLSPDESIADDAVGGISKTDFSIDMRAISGVGHRASSAFRHSFESAPSWSESVSDHSSLPALSTARSYGSQQQHETGNRAFNSTAQHLQASIDEPYLNMVSEKVSLDRSDERPALGRSHSGHAQTISWLSGRGSATDIGHHIDSVRRDSGQRIGAELELLSNLKIAELQQRAMSSGADVEKVEIAMEQDDPKDALIELISALDSKMQDHLQERQIFFDLVKDKRELAVREGFASPSIASPRNRYVESLLNHKAGDKKTEVSVSSLRPARLSQRQLSMARVNQSRGSESPAGTGEVPGVSHLGSFHKQQIEVAPFPLLQKGMIQTAKGTIKLNEYRIGDKLGIALGHSLVRLGNELPVQELLLTKCSLAAPSIRSIATALSSCEKLRVLDLSGNSVGELGAAALAAAAAEHPSLTVLKLSNVQVKDADVGVLLKALQHNHTLEELDLSRNNIGNGPLAGRELAKVLTRNETLTILNLAWNNIRGDKGAIVMQSLRYNQTLKRLDLSWNGLADQVGSVLGSTLRFNESIESINVSHCGIATRAAFVFADMFRENLSLKEVIMDGNPLGLSGGSAMLRALRASHILDFARGLYMRQCNFDEAVTDSAHAMSHTGVPKARGSRSYEGPDKTVVHTIDHFDPSEPAGSWRCDLGDPYERAVANELVELAWAEEDENWENETLNGAKYNLPEPPPGVMWTRGHFSLPEEGILKLNYAATPRQPRMKNVLGADFLATFTGMMDDRNLVDQGLGLLKVACGAFYFSAHQVGNLVRRFIDSVSRVSAMAALMLRTVDYVNITQEALDSLTDGEMRSLEVKMGKAFYFIPGNSTGHYSLELGNQVDRAIARRLIAISAEEKQVRVQAKLIDLSSRGDMDNWRNETITSAGKNKEKFNYSQYDAVRGRLPQYGNIEFDYYSTNTTHLQLGVKAMADDVFQLLQHELELVKTFCVTEREKMHYGPLLFKFAQDERKEQEAEVRERFESYRAKSTLARNRWKAHEVDFLQIGHEKKLIGKHISRHILTDPSKKHVSDKVMMKIKDAWENAADGSSAGPVGPVFDDPTQEGSSDDDDHEHDSSEEVDEKAVAFVEGAADVDERALAARKEGLKRGLSINLDVHRKRNLVRTQSGPGHGKALRHKPTIRPCWWTPLAFSPTVVQTDSERHAQVARRQSQMLRRASLEYWFSAAQLTQARGLRAVLYRTRIFLVPVDLVWNNGCTKDNLTPLSAPVPPQLLERVPVEAQNAHVEVLVTLVGRLVDPENLVLSAVLPSPEAQAAYKKRVGLITCFNPYKPDGTYALLNLALYEDFTVATMLLQLANESGAECPGPPGAFRRS